MRYSGGIVVVIECNEWSQREMARYRQSLGKEIGQILKARDEDDAKLTLLNPIPQPMKPHIQGLGHFGGDGVVGEANRNLIVAKNGCCWLRMTHVGQDLPLIDSNARSCKHAGVFRLGYKRTNYGDAGRMVRDGVVKEFLVILMTEEMVRPRDASGFRAGEVRRIREDA
jgi:hypothetical protein